MIKQKEQRKIVEIILENSANIAFLCFKTLDKIVEIFFRNKHLK